MGERKEGAPLSLLPLFFLEARQLVFKTLCFKAQGKSQRSSHGSPPTPRPHPRLAALASQCPSVHEHTRRSCPELALSLPGLRFLQVITHLAPHLLGVLPSESPSQWGLS